MYEIKQLWKLSTQQLIEIGETIQTYAPRIIGDVDGRLTAPYQKQHGDVCWLLSWRGVGLSK